MKKRQRKDASSVDQSSRSCSLLEDGKKSLEDEKEKLSENLWRGCWTETSNETKRTEEAERRKEVEPRSIRRRVEPPLRFRSTDSARASSFPRQLSTSLSYIRFSLVISVLDRGGSKVEARSRMN